MFYATKKRHKRRLKGNFLRNFGEQSKAKKAKDCIKKVGVHYKVSIKETKGSTKGAGLLTYSLFIQKVKMSLKSYK